MKTENRTVRQLQAVAARLTCDQDLQKDLVQEMLLHLVRVEEDLPGRTVSWYITSCQFHARHYLDRGRSVDSMKRWGNLVPLGAAHDDGEGGLESWQEAADPVDPHGELIMQDIVNLLVVRLTDTQQRVLFLLIRGFGVREIGRELRLSHSMIVRHRRAIGRVTSWLLADSGCNGARNRSRGSSSKLGQSRHMKAASRCTLESHSAHNLDAQPLFGGYLTEETL